MKCQREGGEKSTSRDEGSHDVGVPHSGRTLQARRQRAVPRSLFHKGSVTLLLLQQKRDMRAISKVLIVVGLELCRAARTRVLAM